MSTQTSRLSSHDLQTWRVRIDHATRLQTVQHRKWLEAHWMVEGLWYQKQGFWIDPDATAVNYATAYVKTILAAIYARTPYIFIRARNTRYATFAQVMEDVVNYLWVELDLKAQIKRAIIDAVITGIGWVEVGYTATFESFSPTDTQSGFLSRLLGTLKPPETQGVLNEFVKEQAAYALRLSPWKVFLAPGYHDIHAMPYLLVAEDIAPEDLKQHPLYAKALDIDGLKPTRNVKTGDQLISVSTRSTSSVNKSELLMVRLWHIWDRRGNRRFTLVDGSDQYVEPVEWPYCFEGFAQVPLIFNEIPETKDDANGYPMSDITPMIPQLKELSLLRTAMIRHRKRSGTIITTRKGAVTEEQRSKLQSGDDVTILEVDDPTGITNHSPPALPPDLYRINQQILADLDLIGGLSQVMVGAAPGKDRTATEVNITAQGTSLRTSEKVDVIEKFSMDIGRRLAAVAWEFLPREFIRELTGETAVTEAMWPPLPEEQSERRTIIQRELEFRLEAGATRPIKDRTIEREQKLRLINILMQTAPDLINRGTMMKQLLRDFDMKEIDQIVIGDEQGEQQAAMQEEQLLAQNLPQVVGPNENHDVHLQVHASAAQQAPPTQARDQHLMAHQQAKLAKSPQTRPQRGDEQGTRQAAVPDQLRQGIPQLSDMMGAVTASVANRGHDQGGIPNL